MRSRVRHSLDDMRGWWDWSAWAMSFAGRDDSGSYSPPEPRAWYWYEDGRRYVIAKTYDEKRRIDEAVSAARAAWHERHPRAELDRLRDERDWDALKDDRCPEDPYWHHFNVQDDGHTLIPGNVYGDRGGVNYGLDRRCSRALVRYVVVEWWLKADWLGLRPWVYYKGLHRRVDMRQPFRCSVRPTPGSGGYSHWACLLPRGHEGPHRVNNYTWLDGSAAEYAPRGNARTGDVQ